MPGKCKLLDLAVRKNELTDWNPKMREERSGSIDSRFKNFNKKQKKNGVRNELHFLESNYRKIGRIK